MTLREVANEVGATLGAVKKWEQGRNAPYFGNLHSLARFYGVTVSILTDENRAMRAFLEMSQSKTGMIIIKVNTKTAKCSDGHLWQLHELLPAKADGTSLTNDELKEAMQSYNQWREQSAYKLVEE